MSMRKQRMVLMLLLFVLVLALVPLAAWSGTFPEKHPVEVTNGLCSACHTDKQYGVEHTTGWYGEHRFRAAQNEALCAMCHEQAYCVDCHAGREELRPSEKYTEDPKRNMPHRGDYITRHKVDARIDPAPCFRCHGRGNNGKCRVCHR